jgi:hypothetical protein
MNPKVALIDGDPLVYKIGFGAEGAPVSFAKARLSSAIQGLAFETLGCERALLAISPSGRHYRHELAVTKPYKGNRKGVARPEHYKALRVMLEGEGAYVAEGCEADDVLGHWSTEYAGDCVICSVDKDLLMLPGLHFNYGKQIYTEVTPEQGLLTFYRQLIGGDATDNIQGMGFGAKKFQEELELGMTEAQMAEIAVLGFWHREKKDEQKSIKEKTELYQASPENALKRFIENGHLCWIQREPGKLWEPPEVNIKDLS